MKLHIVRHAQKKKGEFYSNKLVANDNPISENGKLQAKLLSDYLLNYEINSIYISEYLRTKETLEPYLLKTNKTYYIDNRINEIKMGEMTKYSLDEISELYPQFYTEFQLKKTDFRYPCGENGYDVSLRIKSLINELLIQNKNCLLVSHDGWIRILICYLLGIDYWKRFNFTIANCGITIVDINENKYLINSINECSYLGMNISYDN